MGCLSYGHADGGLPEQKAGVRSPPRQVSEPSLPWKVSSPSGVEGQAEGWAQGRANGKAKTLERVLMKRFGKIPSSYRAAMTFADVAQLDAWIERAIDAGSIEGVFAVDAH